MRWPQVDEAVKFLEQQGQHALALAVNRCHEVMLVSQRSAQSWRNRAEELMAKYEARTNVPPFTRTED